MAPLLSAPELVTEVRSLQDGGVLANTARHLHLFATVFLSQRPILFAANDNGSFNSPAKIPRAALLATGQCAAVSGSGSDPLTSPRP